MAKTLAEIREKLMSKKDDTEGPADRPPEPYKDFEEYDLVHKLKYKELKYEEADEELLCPVCGESYTHFLRVELYFRNEDDAKGTHISVRGDSLLEDERYATYSTTATVHQDDNLNGNVSRRRGSVKLHFKCEFGHNFWLCYSQHKGLTYFGVCK
jgi:hypothetical protein